ncbi:MAG TPA: phosphorylase, partial [Allocoleopsis sp.]
MFKAVLVPKGAEYQAVCQGLKTVKSPPVIFPIPIGVKPVTTYLQNWQKHHTIDRLLIMGLCGSLHPKYHIGDIVIYQDCLYNDQRISCDRPLTNYVLSKLPKAHLVTGLTTDKVISQTKEKIRLGDKYQADVVDMEGYAALDLLGAKVHISIVRVISDNCDYNIPDITLAINSQGNLQTLKLAKVML